MTLIGVNPQNHPQQVGKRGAKDTVDERHIRPWVDKANNSGAEIVVMLSPSGRSRALALGPTGRALDIIDQCGSSVAPDQWSKYDQPEYPGRAS